MSGNGSDKKIGEVPVPGILHPYFIIDPKHLNNLKTQNDTQKPKLPVDHQTPAKNCVDNLNIHPDTISSQHRNNTTITTDIETTTSKHEQTTPTVDQNKTQFSLRRGKWTPEEERYASLLIEEFEKGTVKDCDNGCTLRAYLSRKLQCAPMRISKKFAGKSIGKHVFLARALTCNELLYPGKKFAQDNTDKLRELEFKFHMSLHHESAGMLGIYRQNPPLILPNLFCKLNPPPNQPIGSPMNVNGLSQNQNLVQGQQLHGKLAPTPQTTKTNHEQVQSNCLQTNDQVDALKNSYYRAQNALTPAVNDTTTKNRDERYETMARRTLENSPKESMIPNQQDVSYNVFPISSLNHKDSHLISNAANSTGLTTTHLGNNQLSDKVSNFSELRKSESVDSKMTPAQDIPNVMSVPPYQNLRNGIVNVEGYKSGIQNNALESSSGQSKTSDLSKVDNLSENRISSNMYALYAQQSAMAVSKHSAYCRNETVKSTQVELDALIDNETRTHYRTSRGAAIVEDDSTNGSSSTRIFINLTNRSGATSDKADESSRSSDSNQSQNQKNGSSRLNSRKRHCPSTYNFSTVRAHPDSVAVSEISSDVGTEPDFGTNSSKESSNDSGSGSDSACDNNSCYQYDTISDEGPSKKSTLRKGKKIKTSQSADAGRQNCQELEGSSTNEQ